MSTINIWVTGPGVEYAQVEAGVLALAKARALGYQDPAVARVEVIHTTHGAVLGVIVAEGEEEAEAHRTPRRRRGGIRIPSTPQLKPSSSSSSSSQPMEQSIAGSEE